MPYVQETLFTGAVIEVIKKYTWKCKAKKVKRNPKTNETPEQQKKVNENNARKKLRQLINTNFKYNDYHLILTYEKDKRPQTAEEAKYNLEKFLRKLRVEYKKNGKELKYIATTEYKRSVIHHHLVINYINPKVISKVWEHGRPKINPLDQSGQYEQLANYLIKETRLTFSDKENRIYAKRWCSSKNLKQPVRKVKIVSADSWREEPIAKKGYYIEKCYSNVNDITGYPYQFYSMRKIDPYQEVIKHE